MSPEIIPTPPVAAVDSPQSRLESRISLSQALLPAQLAAAVCLLVYGRYLKVTAGEKGAIAVVAATLAATAVWSVISPIRRARSAAWLSVAAAAAYFVWRIDNTQLVHGERLYKAGLGLALAAWIVIWALRHVARAPPLNAALFVYSIAITLLVGEAVTPRLRPDFDIVRKSGRPDLGAHPFLGWVNLPLGNITITFPDDPRGYFYPYAGSTQIDMRRWSAVTFEDSKMDVVKPAEPRGVLRAAMTSPQTADLMSCNLSMAPFTLEKDRPYHLKFRMRGDQPRRARVECSQSHPPWQGLGLRETIELTPEWQEFSFDVKVSEDEPGARLKFDVGQSDIAVELAGVEFDAPGNIEGPDGAKYYMEMPANELGFRGQFPPEPKSSGVFRIVALGDSFTFGFGVKEADTFVRELERRFNEGPKPAGVEKVECMNFGVCGYGTSQERRCYELYAHRWQPDLVILSMVHNDTITSDEDLLISVQGPDAWQKTFYLARWAREPFLQRFHTPYEACIPEILSLKKSCQRDGAKLMVSIFRHQRLQAWVDLAATMERGLAGTDIPCLDLGQTLLADAAPPDLLVHDRIDSHPNEIAHRIAAEALERFVRENDLFSPARR